LLGLRENVLQEVKHEEIAGLLQELVKIPSRNPPGEEKKCAEYIAYKASKWGLKVDLIPEPYPERPQVVISVEGSESKPTLVLNGHIDTVPEGDVEKWSVEPFSGVIKDGRMYGRGACDMKSGLAAALIAAKAIKKSGVSLRGNLIVHCAIGEETGEPGTKTLLEKGFKGDWGVVLEPTNLKVAIVERGLAWFHIIVKGRSAHASIPHKGVNAITKATAIVSALEDYNKQISKEKHPLVAGSTCTVTMIEGGLKENVVPDSCKLVIDRRILPGTSVEQVESELKHILSKLRKKDSKLPYELKRVKEFESASISRDSEIVEALENSLRDIGGIKPKIWGTPYSSDVRNFINDAKIPAVTFGPGDISEAHAVDESVELEKVTTCSKVLASLAADLLA